MVKWRVLAEVTLGSAVQVDKLVRWAQDPASLGRRPHGGKCRLLNMALSFSPSPALACVRSLFLSLPSPPSPSVARVVLALGVAWECQGRVGVFATVRQASVSRALCAW